MTAVDVTYDGVDLSDAVPGAYVTKVVRPLVGARRHRTKEIPGRAGSWIFGEEPGDRILEVSVDIQGISFADRRAAVVALADWCDRPTPEALILSDEPDRYHLAILDRDADPDEWLLAGSVVLRFRAGPYSLASTITVETIAAAGAGTDSGTFSAVDTIDAEPIIEITPTNGTITTFALTVNDDELGYSGPTVASGNTVTISTISDTVTQGVNGDTMLTGAYSGTVVMSGVSGVFPLIVPGTNTWAISWAGTATAVTVEISWRRRYR